MSTSIPVELRDRIMRAREVVSAAARLPINDLRRKWLAVAAAKSELADAYQAVYELAPTGTVLSVALLDAYAGMRDAAYDAETRAAQIPRKGPRPQFASTRARRSA